MTEPLFHSVTEAIPEMTAAEYEALRNDIAQNGLLEPIWRLPDGQIIDGRHRYRACEELGIQQDYTIAPDLDMKELLTTVVKRNLSRRQLSYDQRAMVAARLLMLYEEEARAKQRAKSAWIAEVRSKEPPLVQEPCLICDRYVSVTQAHHVLPLAIQFDLGVALADQYRVSLCPTHHVAVHKKINALLGNKPAVQPEGFDEEEKERLDIFACDFVFRWVRCRESN